MKKLIASLLAFCAFSALPVSAQLTMPTQFQEKLKQPTLTTEDFISLVGKGGLKMAEGGTVYRLTATQGSVTTGAKNIGITLPARTLISNGRGLRLRIAGTCAANANSKTVTLVFGSTSVTLLNTTANGTPLYADVMIYRTGLNAQRVSVAGYANGALFTALSANATNIETGTITLNVQLGTATANNDFVLDDFTITAEAG